MDKPSGFTNSTLPNHVCRLRKAIYGFDKRLVLSIMDFVIFYYLKASLTLIQTPPYLYFTFLLQFFIYWFMLMTALSRGCPMLIGMISSLLLPADFLLRISVISLIFLGLNLSLRLTVCFYPSKIYKRPLVSS